jgi:hypothetical protein
MASKTARCRSYGAGAELAARGAAQREAAEALGISVEEMRERAERAMLQIARRRHPRAQLAVVWSDPDPVGEGGDA